MILTPISPDRLPEVLRRFAASLPDDAVRRVFDRIALPDQARRAAPPEALRHQQEAWRLSGSFGMGLLPGRPGAGFSWDGSALRAETEAYVLLHEIAHFQLASPARRTVVDFGLGAGPETGDRNAADRAAALFGLAREREEAMASLLGVLWEIELGQPGLASFLDQNWLEGAGRPGAADHFRTILTLLRKGGFVTGEGRPTRRLRQAPDPLAEDAAAAG